MAIADVDFTSSTVTQFGYREKNLLDRVDGGKQSINDDGMKQLERDLAEASGARRDNHTIYKIVCAGQPTRFIMFSDLKVYEGRSVTKEDW